MSFVGNEDGFKLYNMINYAIFYKTIFYIEISILSYMTHDTLSWLFQIESGPWLYPELFYSVIHIHIAVVLPRAGLR